jgi:hypothetical protein
MMHEALPLAFRLNQNYPNPFKEKTRITYCVAYRTRVHLTVVNSAGEVIDTLVDEEKNAGTYEVEFSACSTPSGEERSLTDGVYSYRMEAADYSSEKKMQLLG